MDRVLIKGAKFAAHVGTSEEERSRSQEIELDIVLWLDLRKAGKRDDYTRTVCYARIYECVAGILSSRRFALIEAIAETAAASVLDNFPVERARITVKKPEALASKGVEYCAVRITRRRRA